ncbi:MAG: Lcl C-terminal domain-containing protein [Planctomycetota bacterium]|jgi:hypothetical protein
MYKKFNLITVFIGISVLVAVLTIATQTEAKYRGVEHYVEHQREHHENLKENGKEKTEVCDKHEDAERHHRGGFLGKGQLPPGLERVFRKFNAGPVTETNGVPAPVAKTGQSVTHSTGDDGELQKGVAWPNDRFTDNSDGTVTDNLTGLIWLKDAMRFGAQDWDNALNMCNNLADDGVDLTDGSVPGDWRLPNVKELLSLVHYGFSYPTLPDTAGTAPHTDGDPFINVQSWGYWTSTSATNGGGGRALRVSFSNGDSTSATKGHTLYVWCVRGGQ